MSDANGVPNSSGSQQPEHPEVLVDGEHEHEHEHDGPQEVFLDDDDIAELQAAMDEEGDFPMSEDEDDVEEVDEEPPEGEEGEGDGMAEDIEDMSSAKFRAHLNPVFSISTHPTCRVLAVSGGEDDNGYLWRLDTGEEVAKLAGHTDSVITTGWSSDGEMVATGGMDGRVRVWRRAKPAAGSDAWEWAKWEFLTTLEGMDEVTWLDWHPKGAVLVCGTGDGTVWMWQLPSGRNMNVFSGHAGPVTCGRFLPDGKRLVTGSEDGTFIVWDPKSSTPMFKLAGHDGRFKLEGGVTCVAVNAASTACIVGGADGGLKVVNLTNGTIATTLECHDAGSSVESVAWSQGTAGSVGLWVTAGTDKKVKVFEASNGAVRWTGEHEDAVTSIALHPASTHLVSTGSVDRTVRTWDMRTGRLQKSYTGHEDVIHTVACSSDGKLLVSGSDDSSARVFVV